MADKKAKVYSADYFRSQGKIGGTRRAANLTPAQRKASAVKASKAAAIARSKKKRAKETKA
jgi:hypothetical protein